MFGKYVLTITHAQTVGHAGKFSYPSQLFFLGVNPLMPNDL
jgi:hypothetical protein